MGPSQARPGRGRQATSELLAPVYEILTIPLLISKVTP